MRSVEEINKDYAIMRGPLPLDPWAQVAAYRRRARLLDERVQLAARDRDGLAEYAFRLAYGVCVDLIREAEQCAATAIAGGGSR